MSNFIDFSCFVSMFPHLVAGPILKFSFLAEQLKHRTLTSDKFARGVAFFMLGLAKKILLANPCGKIADTAFNAGSIGTLDAWFGSVALRFPNLFRFQRLLRHGDRARPDVRLRLREELRFALPRGIDHRFLAALAHLAFDLAARISLHPARRKSPRHSAAPIANLVITMLLGGLWHGASWNFVIWGGMHGAHARFRAQPGSRRFLSQPAETAAGRRSLLSSSCSAGSFSARPISLARSLISASMFGLGQPDPSAALLGGILYRPYYLLSLGLAALVVWKGKQTWDWTQRLTLPKTAICFALGWLALVVLATQEYNPFIYFIF